MTDLSEQTKYYKYFFNQDTKEFEMTEIPLNRDNWGYVQLDASIRTAFLKFNTKFPKYVVLTEGGHYTWIDVYRADIENAEELFAWQKNKVLINSELNQQAEANSTYMEDTENWIIYKFKVL